MKHVLTLSWKSCFLWQLLAWAFLFLGVCWKLFEQMWLWFFTATSWSSTLLYSSSPFGLSYLHTPAAAVTYSLPVPCPSALTSSIGFFSLAQTLGELRTINTAAKLCFRFVSFSFHLSRIATWAACPTPSATANTVYWETSAELNSPRLEWQADAAAAALVTLVSIRLTKRHCKFNITLTVSVPAWVFFSSSHACLLSVIYLISTQLFSHFFPSLSSHSFENSPLHFMSYFIINSFSFLMYFFLKLSLIFFFLRLLLSVPFDETILGILWQ